MFSGRLWELFLDSFPKILFPGLTMTIPLGSVKIYAQKYLQTPAE